MAKEKNWFTKTIAREAVEELTKELVESGDISSEVGERFNKLFASSRRGGGSTTVKVDGEIVGKKCSYLGRYLPISEFGTMGTEEDGVTVKYAYQSKEGAKLARASKSTFEKAIEEADLELEETEDIKAWKEAKAKAREVFESPVVSDLGYETEEELIASL